MSTDTRVVEWYRSCIHEKQRKANALSIEVELNAREKEDAVALAEAMECLDSAIVILEQAKVGLTEDEPIEKPVRVSRRVIPEASQSGSEPLMDDLGHSMTTIDLAPLSAQARRPAGMPARRHNGRERSLDWRRLPTENSLSFFQ